MGTTPDVRPVGNLPDSIGKTAARELSLHGITTLKEVASHSENLARADALLFGRVTYEMMEAAWRESAQSGLTTELRNQDGILTWAGGCQP